jgi:ubiquinone/menaquinone biosynthesis C-methylase UbiE
MASAGDEFKAFEAEGWTARAQTYGELSGQITRRFAEPVLDAARVEPGQSVLDVATGPGYVAELAGHRGARPTGLDIAEGMLLEARRRLPTVKFVAGDAEALPFDDASFDAVVGNFVINHLPDPERGIAEAARVLVTGGRLAFSAWQTPDRMLFMGLFAEAIEAAGVEDNEAAAGIPPAPDPYRYADAAEFQRLLESAGLVDLSVEELQLVHHVPDVDALWNGFFGGSVRGSTFVGAQPEPVRKRIREELERACERHLTPDGIAIPVAANIGSGSRP